MCDRIEVTSRRIIGTKIELYEAWERTSLLSETYCTLNRINDQVYGRIGSERKGNKEDQFNRAYEIIMEQYTELKDKDIDFRNGTIEVWY